MKLHAIFLRDGSALPDRFVLRQEPFCRGWMVIEDIAAVALDAKIRKAGWHFMWMVGTCRRRGYGLTEDRAIEQAVKRALNKTGEQFNASELDSVVVKKFPGFFLARVMLQPRLIQQQTSMIVLNA